ncbi:hypothetical protein BD560DRAFT_410100 [Blakeslea trispora]|nr:hypothetical protein BD560DRAFT_410100 [Blakeslea trispora]
MEGLHLRKKLNKEDENEFLDEEEQEKLLQELNEQNDHANTNIQRGLVMIGLIMLAPFLQVLLQDGNTLPISLHPSTIQTASPHLASTCSLFSILLSIITLVLSSSVPIFPHLSIQSDYTTQFGWAAAILALMPIFQARQSSWIEFGFWCLPLFVVFMYYSAFVMIRQVSVGIKELEKSRYRYKGA